MLAEKVEQTAVSHADFQRIRERISLFGGLSDHQMDVLLPKLKEIFAREGDTVFRQEQLPCNVYIVLSGEVLLEVAREDGSCCTMTYLPGDCFGETAVIGIQPQLGLAKAEKDSQLLVLSRSCLMDLLSVDKELFGILMMNVAREVSRRLHAFVSSDSSQTEYAIVRATS